MTWTDVSPVEVLDRSVACLGSDRRLAFLAERVYELSLAARSLYPRPDTDEYRAAAGFICHNEFFQVLASQLRADVGGLNGGYPKEALIEALAGKASTWGCEAGLRDALERALETISKKP